MTPPRPFFPTPALPLDEESDPDQTTPVLPPSPAWPACAPPEDARLVGLWNALVAESRARRHDDKVLLDEAQGAKRSADEALAGIQRLEARLTWLSWGSAVRAIVVVVPLVASATAIAQFLLKVLDR